MKPTEILSDEHRVIEQVLSCLESMIEQFNASGKLERQPAGDAVDFFRTFADHCHHMKEETHLFPVLEAKGFSPVEGPTGVMRHEHELARGHVGALAGAIEAAAAGDAAALAEFTRHGREYIALLCEHIEKEDHCLYPMADAALTPEDQQELLKTFEKVEREEIGAGTHERYLQLAADLAERFGVTRAVTSGAGHCGHGCQHQV